MECNCNNNNSNGGVIPWVRGNRLPLIICVYENVVTQEQVGDSTLTVNEMTRVPYTIQDNDTVTVIMKSGFRQVEMPFTTDGNKVMVTDNGELPTGAYTVEVTIERGDGARGRWQETRQVRIYENTSDAQLGEMYSIDADLFFYAKGDTGTGIADITNNPDGTLTITMTDGTSYVTEALKGDKGDKGDTGERGVSIVSFDVTGQTDVSVIYTVTFSDDTTQDISVPKGPQGDTGLTGNGISTTTLNSDYTLTIAYTDGTTYTTPSIRGAQGAQGVSVIGFTQTGETATNTMYNLVFSDGRTQSVAIPKGVKGDKGDTGATGATGAQGPKGDTVIIGDEQTYTLYGVTGQNSDGAMTQKAVTDELQAEEEKLFESIKENYTINNAGTWTGSTSNHYLVKVNGGDRIRVTANANANTQLRWLTEYAIPDNGNPAPVVSTGSAININAGESSIVIAPANAEYLFALGTHSGVDHTPASYTRIKYAKEVLEDVSYKVDNLSVYGNINCQFSRNYGINSSALWTNSIATHYIIKVHEGMSLKVTANADNYALLYWLKNSNNPVKNQKAPISDIDPSRYEIAAGDSLVVTAPSDAQYLFVYGTNESTVYTPSKIELVLENKIEESILEKQLVKQDIVASFPMTVSYSGISYIWKNNQAIDKHTEIEVEPGDLVEVTAEIFTSVYFLKEHINPTADNSVLVSDFAYYRNVLPVGETKRFIVPEDSHILCLTASGADFSSTTVKVSGKESFESAGITKGVECDLGWAGGTIFGYNAKKYLGKEILVAVENAAEDVVVVMLRDVTGSGISTIGVYLRGGYGSVTIPDNDDIHYIYISSGYGQSYIIDKDSLTDTILRTGNKYKESLAASILAEGKCISPAEYLYAFGAYNWYYDNKIWTMYSANLALDADDTTVQSDAVITEYSLYDGTTENHIMNIASAIDQNGDAVTPFTHCYNGLGFLTLDNKVGYWTLFGNASNKNYNFGYNIDIDIDSLENTITRARLTYNDTTVEFTINNYRQMLYALGLTSSYKESGQIYQDNTCIVVDRDNNCYYVVLCSAQGSTGANIAFPLVLLKSYDLKLWEYIGALDNGTAFSAYEMQAVIKNEKLYLVYRHQPAPEGFGCVIADMSDLSTIFKREWNVGCVLSRPCCFDVNGEVYITFNTNPCVFAIMDEVNQDRWARRSQQSVFKFVDDIPVFQFNIANPVGFNYPWFCKVTYEPYYDCTNEGSDTALTATIPHYALNIAAFGKGVQIRMIHKHTAGACTLNISNTGAKTLYYNNAAVSSSNTWDDGEVLDVFYNKSTGRYMATPADTTPRYGTESLYVSWSEDRRYLYRRQLANISIANITPVFTRE